ncbi:MAG: FAD-dependent oxidoreductase [Candidatus Aenigmarchaeota archaeon]|nr:FAD-dependent oxidoreductase [Candidatus Aenigmarchaeota archaeon]
MYDVLILGAGPAGLSAAIYASRYGLSAVVIAKGLGMVAEIGDVENYPGIYPVKGQKLITKFRKHAKKFRANMVDDEILSIEKKGKTFTAKTRSSEFSGKAMIYALGSSKKKMGLKEEARFIGKGISYCATCDAALFRGKTVAVLGGANSAITTAIILSGFAKKVYIIYRRGKFRAAPSLTDKIRMLKNVEVLFNSTVTKIEGKSVLDAAVIKTKGKSRRIDLDGMFVEFGYEPNSALAKKLGVKTGKNGRIIVKNNMSTNIPGVFAAGNVTTGSNTFDQIITAAAEGAIAAYSVYRFLT